LRGEAKALFTQLSAMNPHLNESHAPLLGLYATALVKTTDLEPLDDPRLYERITRTTIALARALRLTPQSSTRPERIETQQAKREASSAAQELRNFRASDED
jgi:hypothetical protein